ncbi:hypothetical protein SNE40_019710 [Patella caerulea]|uniref:Integrase catalytic domain-containing protein n=1 Tax=Patella caerulea TaxID=87958 RepID=A0AAN8JBR6_PATCE
MLLQVQSFPQSNGLAEVSVKTVKRLIQKAVINEEDPCLALLSHRCTPGTDGYSPAQKLFNRHVRSLLPRLQLNQTDTEKPNRSKWYDHGAKSLPDLEIGDSVRLRFEKHWEKKGEIVEKAVQPRSYIVKTDEGNHMRRNRRDLLKTKEKFTIEDYVELSDDDCEPGPIPFQNQTSAKDTSLMPNTNTCNNNSVADNVSKNLNDFSKASKSGRVINRINI